MSVVNIEKLAQIAEIEFSEIVDEVIFDLNRMRIILKERSYIDIWYSLSNIGRYAYHWERKIVDGTIYRHNNAPHKKWERISTFPKHFHNGNEDKVETSEIPDEPEKAIRYFLTFVKIKTEEKV